MALCALLVATPMLFTFTNGYSQFGCRHFVPMTPFLLVIIAQRPLGLIGKALIWVSIFLVAFGVVSVHKYGLVAPW